MRNSATPSDKNYTRAQRITISRKAEVTKFAIAQVQES